MSDDWRLRATFTDRSDAAALTERLQHGDLEHALAPGRIAVSRDDREVFLYADAREQAEAAERAISELAGREGWRCETELRRWHPEAEEWEDPGAPLPSGGEALAAEHAERVDREREESRELGVAEYEVRVQCAYHRDTVELSDRLAAEGLEPVRRWRFLLVGAADEDAARALADRITQEAPPGSRVTVEGSLAAVAAETGVNPFAVFGGLGL